MRPSALVLSFFSCLAAAGCVEYVPVEVGSIPPDEELRVSVRDETAVRMARHFGQLRSELTASVEPRGPDSLAIIVWLGKDYPGTPFEDVRETVTVGRDEVVELRRRQLSVWRTAVASAAAVVAVGLVADQVIQQGDPNPPPDDGPPPPPTTFRLRLFRFPADFFP